MSAADVETIRKAILWAYEDPQMEGTVSNKALVALDRLEALALRGGRLDSGGIALIQAVEFIRDYPLGVEDQHYDERRADVLAMPEVAEAENMLHAALAATPEEGAE